MRKLILVITAITSITASAAQAEMVRCRTSPNGWCNMTPAPGPAVQRRPLVGFNVNLNTVPRRTAYPPAPVVYNQTGVYREAYREEYRESEDYVSDKTPGAQSQGKPICPDNMDYNPHERKCFRKGTAEEVQQLAPDMNVDPECQGKPAGFAFDRRVRGPNGEQGVDHRVCGRRGS